MAIISSDMVSPAQGSLDAVCCFMLMQSYIDPQVHRKIRPALGKAMRALEEQRLDPEIYEKELASIVKRIQSMRYGWHRVPTRHWSRPAHYLLLHAFKVINPDSDAFTIASMFILFFSAFFATLQTGNTSCVLGSHLSAI